MPVFLGYSHADKAIANRLAAELARHNTHVWVDTWELNVGDSIINRIQEAINESSALPVVLSPPSESIQTGSATPPATWSPARCWMAGTVPTPRGFGR